MPRASAPRTSASIAVPLRRLVVGRVARVEDGRWRSSDARRDAAPADDVVDVSTPSESRSSSARSRSAAVDSRASAASSRRIVSWSRSAAAGGGIEREARQGGEAREKWVRVAGHGTGDNSAPPRRSASRSSRVPERRTDGGARPAGLGASPMATPARRCERPGRARPNGAHRHTRTRPQLIVRHIDSVQQVEILALLRREPLRVFAPAESAARSTSRPTRAPPGSRFRRGRTRQRAGAGYRHVDRGRQSRAADDLLELFARRRLAVIESIYNKPQS